MKSILEKALVHLLNEESEMAQELMHQFVVERARAIHESLREGDDSDFGGDDDSALEEEFFTEADLSDDGAADALENDLDDGDAAAPTDAPMGDMGGDDMGAEAPADDQPMDGTETGDLTDTGGEQDISSKIDNIEDEIQALQAEFDKIMAEFEGGSDDDAVAVADEDTVADDAAPTTDAAGDDEFDDITEGMVDDLKKITTPNVDGQGATGGKNTTAATKSPIAKDAKPDFPHSKNNVGHEGWALETPPSKKDGPDRGRKYDNDRPKATSGNSAVPATGPKGAMLNKTVAGTTKSVIPGTKKK